jgi:hypothetical protein
LVGGEAVDEIANAGEVSVFDTVELLVAECESLRV